MGADVRTRRQKAKKSKEAQHYGEDISSTAAKLRS